MFKKRKRKTIEVTKKDALELLGYNTFELLKDGYTGQDTTSILHENNIHKCDCCKSWKDAETTGGIKDEGIVCVDCIDSDHKIAVYAKKVIEENS